MSFGVARHYRARLTAVSYRRQQQGHCRSCTQTPSLCCGKKIWKRYGFVDAFNPLTGWVDKEVVGIDVGISMLMAENARSRLVWDTFMRNAEARAAMEKCGFHSRFHMWGAKRA
jgi:hypothetical protein